MWQQQPHSELEARWWFLRSVLEFGSWHAGCGIIYRNWGLLGITQSPELPKIIPTLRPLISTLWKHFGAPKGLFGAQKSSQTSKKKSTLRGLIVRMIFGRSGDCVMRNSPQFLEIIPHLACQLPNSNTDLKNHHLASSSLCGCCSHLLILLKVIP